ncbi:hypothetical protein ACQCN2_14710 [Brevibacillus ginsengisoli]|uniref:hypothetical protein n=1 Tax=Brevibacillus ginsengisoli TaxID=363854 RepID=UPI003CE6D714
MIDLQSQRLWNVVGKIILTLYVLFCGCLYLGYCFIINLLHSSFSIVSVPAVVLPFVVLLALLWLRWRRKPSEEKQKARTIYLITALAGLFAVLLMIFILGVHEFQNSFHHERWRTEQDKRVFMVDDLLQRHNLSGMNRQAIYELLGNPSETEYFKEKDNIVYWLGPGRGLVGIDNEWLVIWFDANDRVTRYEITITST